MRDWSDTNELIDVVAITIALKWMLREGILGA